MAQIYCIKNKINGKKYVGETLFTFQSRFKEHQKTWKNSSRPKSEKRPLYDAFSKYGIENFEVYLLENCADEQRWEREKFWISELNTFKEGYNANAGGIGNDKCPYSDEEVIAAYHQHKTIRKTSEMLEIGEVAISNRLKKHNIQLYFDSRALNLDEDKDTIIDLYCNQKKTIVEIGIMYNAKADTISKYLKEWGIDIELHRPSRIKLIGQEKEVIQKYSEVGSIKKVAEIFCVDSSVVSKILKENNIQQTRNISQKKKVIGIWNNQEIVFNSQADAARWVLEKGFSSGTADSISANIGRSCKETRGPVCYGVYWKYL